MVNLRIGLLYWYSDSNLHENFACKILTLEGREVNEAKESAKHFLEQVNGGAEQSEAIVLSSHHLRRLIHVPLLGRPIQYVRIMVITTDNRLVRLDCLS